MRISTSKCKLFFLLYCAFSILSSCEKLESPGLKINNNLEEIQDNTYKKVVVTKKDLHKGDNIFKKLGIVFNMKTQKIKIKAKEDQQSINIRSYKKKLAKHIKFELEKNKLFILEVSSKNPIDNTKYIYELIINDINDTNKEDAYVFFIKEIGLNREKRYLGKEYGISDREIESRKNMARLDNKPYRTDGIPDHLKPYLNPNPPAYVSKADKVGFFLIRFFHPFGYLATELASALQSNDIKIELPLAILRCAPLTLPGFINNICNRLLLPGNDVSRTNLTFFETSVLYNSNRIPLFKQVLPRVSEYIKRILLSNFKNGQVNELLNNLTKEEMNRIDEIIKEIVKNSEGKEQFKELTEKEKNEIRVFISSIKQIIIGVRVYIEYSTMPENDIPTRRKPKCT